MHAVAVSFGSEGRHQQKKNVYFNVYYNQLLPDTLGSKKLRKTCGQHGDPHPNHDSYLSVGGGCMDTVHWTGADARDAAASERIECGLQVKV